MTAFNLAFLGNSNMAGTADDTTFNVYDNIYINTPLYAQPETPLTIDMRIDLNYVKNGLHLEMGNYLRKYYDRIDFTGLAAGGSHIVAWLVNNNNQYVKWITNFKRVIDRGHEIDILFMSVGECGEPDYDPPTTKARLKNLISSIRIHLDRPDLKVVQMYTHNVYNATSDQLNSAVDGLLEVESEISNFYISPMCINLKKHGNHFYFPGYCQMGRQMGWFIKSLAEGNNYKQGRFVNFEYVENNLFKIEVEKADHLNLVPNDFTGLSAWYIDSESVEHEVDILYKYIDGKYIYVAVDSDNIDLPAKVFVRYQYEQIPDVSKYLRYDHWEKVPVDKTGHLWEENYIEITTWNVTDESKMGNGYAENFNNSMSSINFLANIKPYTTITDVQKEYTELNENQLVKYGTYTQYQVKKNIEKAVMNNSINYHQNIR